MTPLLDYKYLKDSVFLCFVPTGFALHIVGTYLMLAELTYTFSIQRKVGQFKIICRPAWHTDSDRRDCFPRIYFFGEKGEEIMHIGPNVDKTETLTHKYLIPSLFLFSVGICKYQHLPGTGLPALPASH